MKRPNKADYSRLNTGVGKSLVSTKRYSEEQDKYIDHLEKQKADGLPRKVE